MSVINKMLRDLDSRQAAGTVPPQTPQSRTGFARGTLTVTDSGRATQRPGLRYGAVLISATVILVGGVAGTWWYRNQNILPQPGVAQAVVAPPPAVSTPVIAVAPQAASSAQSQPDQPDIVGIAVPVPVDPVRVPQIAANAAPIVVAAKVPVVQTGTARADIALKMDSTFKGMPNAENASRSNAAGMPRSVPERTLIEAPINAVSTVAAANSAVPQSPARQSPALEALAQAQSLWSSGSHEAAIDLLRDAVAAAERTNLAATSSGNNSLLASLVRELARMELAEGRVSQALELLTRLEPSLSGFADVWAIRGNAAQRLGRHQESAAAYLMALKLRPDEARWMLGAAVSLAAQGQTAAAAELAEKARAGGVLSREVATYLRQLGVPLRER